MKTYPKIGEKLFLYKQTGHCYVDMCRDPYTVIRVDNQHVYVQSCKLVFNGDRYFNTLPDRIEEDPNGEVLALNWHPKKQKWGIDKHKSGYLSFAAFGFWEYQPYLD